MHWEWYFIIQPGDSHNTLLSLQTLASLFFVTFSNRYHHLNNRRNYNRNQPVTFASGTSECCRTLVPSWLASWSPLPSGWSWPSLQSSLLSSSPSQLSSSSSTPSPGSWCWSSSSQSSVQSETCSPPQSNGSGWDGEPDSQVPRPTFWWSQAGTLSSYLTAAILPIISISNTWSSFLSPSQGSY